jgi:hypothetical protein
MKISRKRLEEIILEEVELHFMNDEKECEHGEDEECDCKLKHEKLLEQSVNLKGEK